MNTSAFNLPRICLLALLGLAHMNAASMPSAVVSSSAVAPSSIAPSNISNSTTTTSRPTSSSTSTSSSRSTSSSSRPSNSSKSSSTRTTSTASNETNNGTTIKVSTTVFVRTVIEAGSTVVNTVTVTLTPASYTLCEDVSLLTSNSPTPQTVTTSFAFGNSATTPFIQITTTSSILLLDATCFGRASANVAIDTIPIRICLTDIFPFISSSRVSDLASTGCSSGPGANNCDTMTLSNQVLSFGPHEFTFTDGGVATLCEFGDQVCVSSNSSS